MSVFIIEALIYVEHTVNIDLGGRGSDYVWKYAILRLGNEDHMRLERSFLKQKLHYWNRTTASADTVVDKNVEL